MMFLAAAACRPGNEAAPVPAIDLSNLDTTVAPGDDFYAYATAGWQRNHPLKAEYSRYGSFDMLRENNEIRLNELFRSLTGLKAKKGSVEQKIADLLEEFHVSHVREPQRRGCGSCPAIPWRARGSE